MPSLQELKASSPGAADMTDAEFALALHEHYYSDEPLDKFLSDYGIPLSAAQQARGPYAEYFNKAQGAQQQQAQANMRTATREAAAKDIVGGTLNALNQGLTFGFSDELAAALNALTRGEGSFDEKYRRELETQTDKLKGFSEANPLLAGTAEIGGAVLPSLLAAPVAGGRLAGTMLGKGAQLVAGSAPGTMTTGRAFLEAAVPGALYSYGKAEDTTDPAALFSADRAREALVGGTLSGLGGITVNKVAQVLGRPTVVDDATQQAAKVLKANNVTALTAGQQTGNAKLLSSEINRGGAKIEDLFKVQNKQFANAVWRDLGADDLAKVDPAAGVISGLDDFSKASMREAKDALTKVYDRFSRHDMLFDPKLLNDIQSTVNKFKMYRGSTNPNPLIDEVSNMITSAATRPVTATGGPVVAVNGKWYNELYKKLGKAIVKEKDDVSRIAMQDLQAALDSAMERGIMASGRTDDLALLQRLRPAYQKFLAIMRATKNRKEGIVSPAALNRAVRQIDIGGKATSLGTGSLASLEALTEAGSIVMKQGAKFAEEPYTLRRATLPGFLTFTASQQLLNNPVTAAAITAGSLAAEAGRRKASGALLASPLGQTIMRNEFPDYLQGLGVTKDTQGMLGRGLDAALPYLGALTTDTFELGKSLEAL